jgi:hypothetical protein
VCVKDVLQKNAQSAPTALRAELVQKTALAQQMRARHLTTKRNRPAQEITNLPKAGALDHIKVAILLLVATTKLFQR